MNCQSLFSGKNTKNINLSSAESAQRVAQVKPTFEVLMIFYTIVQV